MEHGLVLRIERISPQDGQGLRTVVFLKGCPLRCAWCSTPESQSAEPEWFYREARCRGCLTCVRACPRTALSPRADGGGIRRDRERCTGCFACAAACLPNAIGVHGTRMSVEEVMREVRKDSLFYFYSGGGVTLSGSDILLQPAFSRELLTACRDECIHTAAELDMYGPYEQVAAVVRLLSAYFVDIKAMDASLHRRWTSVDNGTILENTVKASAGFPRIPLTVRVPLIPGISDSRDNIEATAEFCAGLGSCRALEFLPITALATRPIAASAVPASAPICRPCPLPRSVGASVSLLRRNCRSQSWFPVLRFDGEENRKPQEPLYFLTTENRNHENHHENR